MRLPRWLVVTLLAVSVLVGLGAGLTWWVTWPARTAREFLELLAVHKYDEAQGYYGWIPGWKNQTYALFRERSVNEVNFQAQPRSLADVWKGRRRFKYGRSPLVFHFTVERGKVVLSGYEHD
jgi:hypothetical protein